MYIYGILVLVFLVPTYFSVYPNEFELIIVFLLQEHVGNMARNLKALITKHSFKDRYKTAQSYLQKLKFLVEDVSFGLT